MRIWVYLNGIQQGPYTIEQIRLLPVDATTPVWYEGLAQWTPAGQAPVTAAMFGCPGNLAADAAAPAPSVAPGELQQFRQPVLPPKPSTYLVWNIILTVLCCSPVSLAGIITGALSSSRYSSGDYDGARKLSNATELLLIISIVWVLVSIPLSIVWSLF